MTWGGVVQGCDILNIGKVVRVKERGGWRFRSMNSRFEISPQFYRPVKRERYGPPR
jgi:hypothetical protein